MPVTTARVKIYREVDNQYALLAFKRSDTGDEIIQESLSGFNIAAATVLDTLKAAIVGMTPGGEKAQEVDVSVLYRP